MSEVGTGYIIQVDIESGRGIPVRDLDFSVDFFVYRNRRATFAKREMVHIAREDGDMYFALLDSTVVGAGELMGCVTIKDPVSQWKGGLRPVIIEKRTGKVIGGVNNTCYARLGSGCKCEWDEGYKVSFNFVYGLPKAEVAYIFYGHIVDQIMDFSQITPDMLVSPENHIVSVSAGRLGKTSVGQMAEGSRVLVLIPSDTDYVATKDNGIGGKVKFNESILGANGDVEVTMDSVKYRVYGELLTTDGELFIYVD